MENKDNKEKFSGTDTSTRIYSRGETSRHAQAGMHLYSKYTNKKIEQLNRKFANREKEVTGNDSQSHIDSANRLDVNRSHQLNWIKQHAKSNASKPVQPKPVSPTPNYTDTGHNAAGLSASAKKLFSVPSVSSDGSFKDRLINRIKDKSYKAKGVK